MDSKAPAVKAFQKWRPHPWHGLPAGKNPPSLVNAYIEITPFDGVKYEIDKVSGYLKVDRPQRSSSLPPALYGFVPQTYCADHVARLSKTAKRGDGDPLDILVLSERPINRSEVIVPARVIGGLKMVDRGEADDKIVAVLDSDPFWENTKEWSDVPAVLRKRLEHYFLTYKRMPGDEGRPEVRIEKKYGSMEAKRVVRAAMRDYLENFA
jgi:inorganic pyrophosphatase